MGENLNSVPGQTLPATSAAALWEGKVCQRQLLAKGNDRERTFKPDREVQREAATTNKDMWEETEISISPQCSPPETDTCCLSQHHHYQ